MTDFDDLTRLAADCHRTKWQFDFSDENRLPVSQARDMVKRAFEELHRIGNLAIKMRDEAKETCLRHILNQHLSTPLRQSAETETIMTDFDSEMQKALEADAEKLSQLTGQTHTVQFSKRCPDCGADVLSIWDHVDDCPQDNEERRLSRVDEALDKQLSRSIQRNARLCNVIADTIKVLQASYPELEIINRLQGALRDDDQNLGWEPPK